MEQLLMEQLLMEQLLMEQLLMEQLATETINSGRRSPLIKKSSIGRSPQVTHTGFGITC
jgi:hypothetical protein